MKNNVLKIRTLTERYFEGETTLQQEQELFRLYRSTRELPPDLESLRQMFVDMHAISTQQSSTRRPAWLAAALAACVLLAVGITVTLSRHSAVTTATDADECVAIIYGKTYTDKHTVMAEMQQALHGMEGADVEAQLFDLFN